jgi:hypothetical protein
MKSSTRSFTNRLFVMAITVLGHSLSFALAALITSIGASIAFAQGPVPGKPHACHCPLL